MLSVVVLFIAGIVMWFGPWGWPPPPPPPPYEEPVEIDDHPVWTRVLLFDDPYESRDLFQLTKSMLFLREATTSVSLVGYNGTLDEYVNAYNHAGLYRAVYVYHDTEASLQNLTRYAWEREELYMRHLHARALPPIHAAYPHVVCFPHYQCVVTVAPRASPYWHYLEELVDKVEAYAKRSDAYNPATSYEAVARDHSTAWLYECMAAANGLCRPTQSMMERAVRNQSDEIAQWYDKGGPVPLFTITDFYKSIRCRE